MGKRNTRITCGFKFQAPKLARVNEVVRGDNELDSLSNDFFNEFAKSVQKDDRMERFQIIVWRLARFRNNHSGGSFEVIRPMA